MSVYPSIKLSQHEVNILYLASNGRTAKLIGDELCRSEKAIHTAVGKITKKLQAKNMTEACCSAIRIGILDGNYYRRQMFITRKMGKKILSYKLIKT
jgi:DNA-binding NarL/FixJ family response regulator